MSLVPPWMRKLAETRMLVLVREKAPAREQVPPGEARCGARTRGLVWVAAVELEAAGGSPGGSMGQSHSRGTAQRGRQKAVGNLPTTNRSLPQLL